jgi:chromosome segregation ATPase
MLPAEVRSFVKMLSILGDPEQIKAIIKSLDDKATEVQTQIDALKDTKGWIDDQAAALSRKQDEVTNSVAAALQMRAEAEAKDAEAEKLKQDCARRWEQLDEREARIRTQQDTIAQQSMKVKLTQRSLDDAVALTAKKQAELDALIASYNEKMEQIKTIAG